MSEVKELPLIVGLEPGNRCPDYDNECAEVKDHAACFVGGVAFFPYVIAETPPAEGYCPHLIGMIRRGG